MGTEGPGCNAGRKKRRTRYEAPVIWLWLAGRDLDEEGGKGRTDATWSHDATRVFYPYSGAPVSAWSKMAHWKRSAIRQALLLGVPLLAWDWWHHPAVTILGLSLLAVIYADHYTGLSCLAVIYGTRHAHRGVRKFFPLKHYWQYVRPFSLTLRAELGIVPTYLRVAANRSSVVLGLPHEYLGSDHERAAITKAVTEKLGVIEPDASWHLEGRAHEVKFTESRPPPLEVLPRHVIPAIQAAREHEIIHGLDKNADVLKRSVHLDSPHVCHCMESGGGKSTATMNAGCQHLYHGGVLIILDVKMLSHMWADGLPNVCYAYTPAMVHQALCWLANDEQQESELTYRKRIGRQHSDIRGEIHTDIGPRILVVVEELNATQNALRSYWRNVLKGKGTSPAAVALDDLSCTGRQMKIHLDYVPQRGSAKAFSGSGSADSRENVGTWVFSNPKDSTWKMLGEGYAKPPPSDHKGRYHMLDSGGLTQFQGVLWTPEEARDFAMSGEKAQPHRDLPFTRHVAPVRGHIDSAAIEAPDLAIVGGQAAVLTRPPSTATIKEFATAAGCSSSTASKRVQRAVKAGKLADAGWDGKEKLYPLDGLKELVR